MLQLNVTSQNECTRVIEEVREEHNATWNCLFEEKGDIAEKHLIKLVVESKHKNQVPILI